MKITKALKAFLVSKGWSKEDADDAACRKAVQVKMLAGELTADKLAELSKPEPAAGGGEQPGELKALLTRFKDLEETVASTNPSAVLAKSQAHVEGSADNVRVKSAVEQYDASRKQAVYPTKTAFGTPHPLAGQMAVLEGRPVEIPSERDKALSAAYFKFALAKGSQSPADIPRGLRMNDHDRDLVNWSLRNSRWSGLINGEYGDEGSVIKVNRRKLNDLEVKALLDDSTSGGIEIAPIEFDDALVTTPVLFGELFPLVNVVTVTRGRRMKGGAVSNPTFTSGVAEGTAITPFTTTSFVTAFDTTIFNAVGAMEIGMDFEEDSPTNIGQIIIQKYGEKSMEWLDRVIAAGDGTTEPEGIFTSSAPTVVPSDNGVGGPPTVGDYEGLMFGVSKAFRNTKGSRNVFLANDTTYRRARSIAVGPGDERRVFGMTHSDYMLLDAPYKVQNNIANTKAAFVNLGYYRLYRRLGLNIRNETAGNYLALRNLRLIVVRMRWGGKIELGGAAAIMTDMQA